jgi:hypothetical protein
LPQASIHRPVWAAQRPPLSASVSMRLRALLALLLPLLAGAGVGDWISGAGHLITDAINVCARPSRPPARCVRSLASRGGDAVH